MCISLRVSLAGDDLYRGDCCLLQSNSHPKWLGRRVVQREIMCLLWTLMIQWKQTNDPPRVSRRVQQLHHSNSVKTWKKLSWASFFLGREGGGHRKKEDERVASSFVKQCREVATERECRKSEMGGKIWEGSNEKIIKTITTAFVLFIDAQVELGPGK